MFHSAAIVSDFFFVIAVYTYSFKIEIQLKFEKISKKAEFSVSAYLFFFEDAGFACIGDYLFTELSSIMFTFNQYLPKCGQC